MLILGQVFPASFFTFYNGGIDYMQPIIKAVDLSYTYMDLKGQELLALDKINLTINPSTNTLETVKNQIKEKYGTGKIDDSRKEEQCIYKNGANFKIMSGSIYTTWIEELPQTEQIKTTLMDVSIETCPSNLRAGGTDPIKIQSLIFRKVKNIVEDQPRNIF